MRRGLILSVVLCAALSSAVAQTPVRDLQAGAAGSGGGESSMPVNVINLPTDPTEAAVATAPTLVSHRLLELIDVELELVGDGDWESEPFSAANFTHYVIKVEGDTTGSLICDMKWQLVPTGTFNLAYRAGSPQPEPLSILGSSGGLPSVKAAVNGLRGRVRCYNGSSVTTSTLTNANVLLTRE